MHAGPSQAGGAGGAIALPVFGQTVNPISTRGTDYTYHSTTSPPPGFSDLATALGACGVQAMYRLGRLPIPRIPYFSTKNW